MTNDHRAPDDPPVDLEQQPLDLDASRRRSLEALDRILQGFRHEAQPLHEQAWLWAEARAVPFRVHPHERIETVPVVGELPSYDRWMATLVAERDAWVQRPLVWRVHEGVAQAVFLGTYRFTWSVAHPEGRCEVANIGQGWTDDTGPLSWVGLCLALLGSRRTCARFGEQVARAAQGHRARLDVWSLASAQLGLRVCPTPVPALVDNESQMLDLGRRFRSALRAFAYALARLDPFWKTVARALWRCCPVGRQYSIGQIERDPLPGLLARWNDWKQVATEHPRAHLLIADAVTTLRLPPNVHTWRPEVWQAEAYALHGAVRSTTWNAVRRGPLAQVATLLRADVEAGMAGLEVMTLCQLPHALPAVLRTVPWSWWIRAKEAFQDAPSLRAAMATFAVRRVRAFLEAAAAHPWREQRLSLQQWLLTMQPVLEWAGFNMEASPLSDPSWSWNSLVRAWMDQEATLDGWSSPLLPCFHRDLRVSVVRSDPAWALLGAVMHNCLKDERSDHLREHARAGQGILVRLSGTESSAVFFTWTPANPDPQDGNPTTAYHRDHYTVVDDRPVDGYWSIDQHYASHNSMPSDTHSAVAQDLAALFNAALVPGGLLPVATIVGRLIEAEVDPARLGDLRAALNPAWGNPVVLEPDGADRPGWQRPWARVWHWANDDRWWTVDGFTQWLDQRGRDSRVTIVMVINVLALVLTGLGRLIGWSPLGQLLSIVGTALVLTGLGHLIARALGGKRRSTTVPAAAHPAGTPGKTRWWSRRR